MKKRSIALLLALIMCFALLSACGGDGAQNTGEPITSGSAPETTGQQPEESRQQPEESEKPEESGQQPEESGQQPEEPGQQPEEPKEDEPEESPEPTQEDHEGTRLLALLKEEWDGLVPAYDLSGENKVWMVDGVIYLFTEGTLYSYDIVSKSLSVDENAFVYNGKKHGPTFARNGIAYSDYYRFSFYIDPDVIWAFDDNGVFQNVLDYGDSDCKYFAAKGDKGFLYADLYLYSEGLRTAFCLYSYDLEKLAEFSCPTYDVEVHGEVKTYGVPLSVITINGTFYGNGYRSDGNGTGWYRLNTDTYEWEETEEPWDYNSRRSCSDFCGKYVVNGRIIYDIITGEKIFESGELPQPCQYFGGNQYLGKIKNADKQWEYRWVDLTNMSVSDPLPFPEESDKLVIVSDTYCVYSDYYGWFLWNYNTGEEETLVRVH